jgi:transcriptional antiterminator RfaH
MVHGVREVLLKRWYAVFTKPRCEYLVAGRLRQVNPEVYLPEIAVSRDGGTVQRRPFFPCYLFVRLDLGNVNVSRWRWMHGIQSLVSFDGQPAEVPDGIIQLIRHKLADADSSPTRLTQFRKGDSVRLKEGPFRNELAIFDGPSQPEERVRVLLEVMGRYHRLNVAAHNLEKVQTMPETLYPKGTRGSRGRGRSIRRG